MMIRNTVLFVASFATTVAASLFASSSAQADEPAEQPHRIAPGVVDESGNPLDTTPKPAFKPFAIELDTTDVGVGRLGVRVELLPWVHHGFTLELHNDRTFATETTSTGATSTSYTAGFLGVGGELGYRFYSGTRGANGFFVGPSVHVEQLSESAQGHTTDVATIGVAVDAGGQWIVGPGIILGIGIGIDYTPVGTNTVASRLPLEGKWLSGDGFRPRTLASVGFAF